MIKTDNTIDSYISVKMLEEHKERERLHREKNPIKKGNLTASMLGKPTQWSVLKMCGLPPKEPDEYSLRKFKRGYQVEDWIEEFVQPVDSQVDIKPYRGVTGTIDFIVNTKNWQTNVGIIPLEIKSVKNSQFSYIINRRTGGPKLGHCLQAMLYALATGSEHYALTYVAADDLRTKTFICHVDDKFYYQELEKYKIKMQFYQEIDLRRYLEDTITEITKHRDEGTIPEFAQVFQEG